MLNPTDQPFAFEFFEYSFVDKGEFTLQPELRLLGRITRGRITRQLPIVVPTARGPVVGVTAQFMDGLDNWLALPFCEWLNVDNMGDEFCLCIVGVGSMIQLICPGTAYLWSPEGASKQ